MAKNMTRKGLAVGAAGALALTGLSALPAQALSVSLTVSEGSSYVGVAGEAFDLTGRWSNDFANWNNALVEVLNPDELNFELDLDDANGVVNGGGAVNIDMAAADADGSADISDTDGSNLTITLTGDDETEAGDITVLIGIDADGSGSLEAGEVRASRTVTFADPADLTFTSSLASTPVIGDTTVDLGITISGGVNVNYVTLANFNATVEDGAAGDLLDDTDGGGATTDEVGLLGGFVVNDDEDGLVLENLGLAAAVAAGDRVVVQVSYEDVGGNALDGTFARKVVADTDLDTVSEDITESDNIREDANGGDYEVRGGYTGNVVVTFAAVDADGDAVAGEVFDVTVSDAGLVDDTVTVNGEDLEAGGDDITFQATSDASGLVSITLKSDTGTDGDLVNVAVAAVLDPSIADDVDVTWVDAGNYVIVNPGVNVENVVIAADETSHSATLYVFDDYGAAVGSGFRFEVDNGDEATFKTLSNGRATMSYTLAGADVDFNLEEQGANGNYAATGDTYTIEWIDADAQFEVDDTGAALGAAAIALVGEEYATADTRMGDTAPDYAAGDGTDVTGSLVDLGGNATTGTVTISGAGLAFSWNDEVYTVGSITVTTDNAGAFSVEVYGNVAGDYTVSVTAGDVTDELDLEVEAADEGEGTTWVVDAPANILPGGSGTFTATLTDDFGNAVDTDNGGAGVSEIAVEYDGPGLTVPVELADTTATDANGQVSFRILLGANDSGTITVTLTYDPDNTVDDDEIVEEVTILVGSPAVATWTKNLNDGTVKMYAKNIVGAGKVQFMLNGEEIAWVNASSSADSKLRSANGFYYLVRTVELVEGQKNVLEIWVDGVRTTRTAYTY